MNSKIGTFALNCTPARQGCTFFQISFKQGEKFPPIILKNQDKFKYQENFAHAPLFYQICIFKSGELFADRIFFWQK